MAMLRTYSGGIIGLSVCFKDEVTDTCVESAVALAKEYSQIFGPNNFFIELQDHGIPEQQQINKYALEVAEITGLPIVATNDVHYIKQSDHEAHDVLICLQQGKLLSDANRMRYPSSEFYMKSGAEMARLFPNHPEAISNTIEIAKRCNVVVFEFDLPAERLHFPRFFPLPQGMTEENYLMELGKNGLKRLYKLADFDHPVDDLGKKVKAQFEYEVAVITKLHYVSYFLVVADYIQWAKDQNIPVGPGRGSSASSILAYALGITDVDPIKHSLIFERFLNPDRIYPPDIDIDFCRNRRREVIRYIRNKYGEDCVAQIITFGTFGVKTVIREVGRVLAIPPDVCDSLAKLVPQSFYTTLDTALHKSPDFKRACETDPAAQQIMKYARQLDGLPRHPGFHAAGLVIGDKPLIEIIPLTQSKEGMTVVQFEQGPAEQIGLLKMDFLGLKNLTTIHATIDLIEINHEIRLDPSGFPLDDAKTFDLLCNGYTTGVFQLESAGVRDVLRQVAPDCFEDLIALLALYRPEAMPLFSTYIKRKRGEEAVVYDHPVLESILKETQGLIIYQEQIMQVVHDLAGFSLGQGDIMRRAMGRRSAYEVTEFKKLFVDGCGKMNGIKPDLANTIFDKLFEASTSAYACNKSHFVAYGLITFQMAYLKANYPEEFVEAFL